LKNLLVATTTAFTLSLTASYAIVAQEQETPKSKFLGNFAGAMVVSFKCKSWKINTPEVELLMGYLHITTKDISPDGPDWPVFQQNMVRAETILRISTRTHCAARPKVCSAQRALLHLTS
jgi:hypothetical protein